MRMRLTGSNSFSNPTRAGLVIGRHLPRPRTRQQIRLSATLTLVWIVSITTGYAQVPEDLHTEAGQVLLKAYHRDGVTIGRYWQYLPSGTRDDYRIAYPIGSRPLPIVVVVHGSIGTDAEARDRAKEYLERYQADADMQWFAVIAPVFDQTNFGGNHGPLGGYRGMVGRHRTGIDPRKSDADGFVNGILDSYQHIHPEVFGTKALFYGHSAGGQFLSRYLVTHPDRVAAMVISSAGTYAFPDNTIRWTNGLSARESTFDWNGGPDRDYVFTPSPSLFKRAAHLPVTVMVGDDESPHECPIADKTPGYPDGSNPPSSPTWWPTGNGTNHLRGSLWVQDMREFAGLGATATGVQFQSLAGVGHQSAQTQPVALPFLMLHRPSCFQIDWLDSALLPLRID